ncbi:MAG: DUF4276 family protein [Aureispira sp.]
MSKRLVFIVEGDTEVKFVHELIIPYLLSLGYTNSMNAQTIITSRKKNKKGGVGNFEYLKNDIKRVFAQGNVIVTTLLDFFRLPTNFPNYSTDKLQIPTIEQGMYEVFDTPDFVPYIQQYEMEALFFSKLEAFELSTDTNKQLQALEVIIADYPNPEDINGGADTAPSKRLETIFGYKKNLHVEFILDELTIPVIRAKCPRFNTWIEKLINKLKEEF